MASFEKVNYLLRPTKQVERKLLVEALQQLAKGGYYIQDYTYLGLGSVYYADFILFHKYLRIERMICVEQESIPKRMEFNKPYAFINLKMGAVVDVIPTLDRSSHYFAWLDYDAPLEQEQLDAIRSCMHVLSPGSIFLVTVPADPRQLASLVLDTEDKPSTGVARDEMVLARLEELIGSHLGRTVTLRDITRRQLPITYALAIRNYIDACLASRASTRFFQLFNFVYADGVQMLSLGGVIEEDQNVDRIQESGVLELDFITQAENPIAISVPPLTVREKIWLEKHVVKNPSPPDEPAFELDKELVSAFARYYRHYPTYYETLV